MQKAHLPERLRRQISNEATRIRGKLLDALRHESRRLVHGKLQGLSLASGRRLDFPLQHMDLRVARGTNTHPKLGALVHEPTPRTFQNKTLGALSHPRDRPALVEKRVLRSQHLKVCRSLDDHGRTVRKLQFDEPRHQSQATRFDFTTHVQRNLVGVPRRRFHADDLRIRNSLTQRPPPDKTHDQCSRRSQRPGPCRLPPPSRAPLRPHRKLHGKITQPRPHFAHERTVIRVNLAVRQETLHDRQLTELRQQCRVRATRLQQPRGLLSAEVAHARPCKELPLFIRSHVGRSDFGNFWPMQSANTSRSRCSCIVNAE